MRTPDPAESETRLLLTVPLAVGLLAVCAIAAPASVQAEADAQEEPDWSHVETTPILTELEGPIDIAISEEGEIWWNEFYSGDVVRYDPASQERTVMFHADPIEDPVERGLLGLALDPDHEDNGVFYVYYTEADPEDPDRGTNHLSRVEDGEETRLLETSAHKRHNGGRIVFDEEGRLFVSTGDNTQGHPAQETDSLLGKILHMHPDGTPAEDNLEGYVYSLGHRNVYGLAYDEANDRLFATENNDLERDEVNLVEPGANYGWPRCQGTMRYDFDAGEPTEEPCDDPELTDPIGEFYEDYTAAPTGATMLDGELYWASWNEGSIHRMIYSEETGEWHDRVVHETDGRIHDLAVHEGAMYYANWSAILRIDGLTGDVPPSGSDAVRSETEPDPTSRIPAVGTVALAFVVATAALVRRER